MNNKHAVMLNTEATAIFSKVMSTWAKLNTSKK